MSLSRVLIAAENYYPVGGGIEQYVRGLARELTRRRCHVEILTQSYGQPGTVDMDEATVHYSDLLTGSLSEPFRVMKRYRDIAAFIRDSRADLVFANNHNSLAMIKAARDAGVPVIYGCHGVGLMCPFRFRFLRPDDSLCYNDSGFINCTRCYFMQKLPFPARCAGWLRNVGRMRQYTSAQERLAGADARIGNSGLCAGLFRKREMTFGITPGIDGEEYQPVDSGEFIRRFRIHGDYLLVPGRLNYIKGQEFAIKALEYLPPDISLVIAGNASLFSGKVDDLGWYGTRIRKLVEDNGWQSRVVFTGFLDQREMAAAYSGARATVIPSVWLETFGYVTLESLACATPVILTGNCGSAECVDDSCGRVVARKDPRAIAEAVKDIWDSAREMGAAGRDKVVRDFNWRITTDRITAVFDRVLKERREG
ncbi:MAG: glycosyltransferase family 4 protein [Chloroflexi bacterium]|nr:glycosyltransferase family 4 protein [Chloroflexota bacterium]